MERVYVAARICRVYTMCSLNIYCVHCYRSIHIQGKSKEMLLLLIIIEDCKSRSNARCGNVYEEKLC